MKPDLRLSKFEVEIINYIDREEPIAEIYYDHFQWSAISPKNGNIIVHFYFHPQNKDWEFSYEEAMEVLERAKNRLFKRINNRSSFFPEGSKTVEEINQLGQEELEKILSHPEIRTYPNRFGGKDVFEPSGKGVRFDKGAHFLGFLQARQWKP